MGLKTREIAKTYKVEQRAFEEFVKESTARFKITFLDEIIVDDDDIDKLVEDFNRMLDENKKKKEEENERVKKEAEEKRRALANILITSGFNFDGYKITKYSGYISGDDAVQVDRGVASIFSSGTNVGDALMESLVKIRRNALQELKEAAYDLGCNAVIGVDFDYITLEPQTANIGGGTTYLPYVFGVTANGNAVIIEKNSLSNNL